jgi:hypothetical protein
MEGLLLAALNVQLASSESWLSHNSGSLLLAVAAIAAATLAALVAILNHRAQLAHDRDMRNREHTRDSLDAAVANVSTAIDVLGILAGDIGVRDLHVRALGLELGRGDEDSDPSDELARADQELQSEIDAHFARSSESELALRLNHNRLELRFGDSHPIVLAHATVEGKLRSRYEDLRLALSRSSTLQHDVVDSELREAVATFKAACRDWFNS